MGIRRRKGKLANSAAAEEKRDQALEQTLTAEIQTEAAEKRKMGGSGTGDERKQNAALQSKLEQKEKFEEERWR